jgi:hypothetical protein
MGKTPRSIQIWFQNRRAKEKIKEINEEVKSQHHPSTSSISMMYDHSSPIIPVPKRFDQNSQQQQQLKNQESEKMFLDSSSDDNDHIHLNEYLFNVEKYKIGKLEIKRNRSPWIEIEFEKNIHQMNVILNSEEINQNDIRRMEFHLFDFSSIEKKNLNSIVLTVLRPPRFSSLMSNKKWSATKDFTSKQASLIRFHEIDFISEMERERFFECLSKLIPIESILKKETGLDNPEFELFSQE